MELYRTRTMLFDNSTETIVPATRYLVFNADSRYSRCEETLFFFIVFLIISLVHDVFWYSAKILIIFLDFIKLVPGYVFPTLLLSLPAIFLAEYHHALLTSLYDGLPGTDLYLVFRFFLSQETLDALITATLEKRQHIRQTIRNTITNTKEAILDGAITRALIRFIMAAIESTHFSTMAASYCFVWAWCWVVMPFAFLTFWVVRVVWYWVCVPLLEVVRFLLGVDAVIEQWERREMVARRWELQ
ncbi:hypothetical protein BJ508DRAFT_327406 [Ascobolus immersus RN42]|uniref:Uncharacterized protein n=1 Tax=Ascobolus immersus RN42 TaxID=1160509 RepID=A0A3N4I848_ASCIM|nr:hypothetical protein BJ508DRAFT_327406 [Ascobolus immersus RN42]